jgi:hypothetical protein
MAVVAAVLLLIAATIGAREASALNVISLDREVRVLVVSTDTYPPPPPQVDLSRSEPDPSVFFEASLEGTGHFYEDGAVVRSARFAASQSSQIGPNAIDLLLDSAGGGGASWFGRSFSSSTFDLVFELEQPSVLSFSASAADYVEIDGAPRPFVFSSDGLMDLNGTATHFDVPSSIGIVYDISGETSAIEGWTFNDSLVI